MFPSNQQHFQDLFKSINQNQVNGSSSTYLSIPVSNSVSSNSTSTSANIQIPSSTSWNNFQLPTNDPQQPLLNDSNSLNVVSNTTTNTNLSNNNLQTFNDQALGIVLMAAAANRNRSQSAGAIPNSISFSPTLSNNNNGNQSFDNSVINMSSSLPNSSTSSPYVSQQQGKSLNNQFAFSQPYSMSSGYSFSSLENPNPNNLEMLLGLFNNTQNQNNMFGQLQPQNFNSINNNQNQFILHSQVPTTNQINSPQVNNQFTSPIMNTLIQPSSPQQVSQIIINQNSMQSVSPTSSSPPTQPFSTLNINPLSSNTNISPNTCSSSSAPSSSKSTNVGKQRKQRAASCSSSTTPYPLTNQSTNEPQESPKRNRRNGIKFAIDFSNNAQKFDIKHTSLTPSSMKKHIAEKDERERAGVKKRGRPKGSGIKQQVSRSTDVFFYRNCFDSVETMYKERRSPRDDDDEGGFTV